MITEFLCESLMASLAMVQGDEHAWMNCCCCYIMMCDEEWMNIIKIWCEENVMCRWRSGWTVRSEKLLDGTHDRVVGRIDDVGFKRLSSRQGRETRSASRFLFPI